MSTSTVAAPTRQQEAAEQALAAVLELFTDPAKLPDAIAQTTLARPVGRSRTARREGLAGASHPGAEGSQDP